MLFEGINNYSGTSQSFINSIFAGNAGSTFLTFGTSGTVDSTATERMRIDNQGRLLVGTSSVRAAGEGFQSSIGTQLFIEQPSSGLTPATFLLNRNDTNGPRIVLGKSRGTTVGSNTIVQAQDSLGFINFAGADGTDLDTVGAQIVAYVDGTPGANDMPGRLVFSTTADGASSPTERMRITNGGNILFNATSVIDQGLVLVSYNGGLNQGAIFCRIRYHFW